MNWFSWLQFAIALASQVIPLIKSTEEAIGAGNGPTKKQMVVAGATMAATMAGANAEQVAATANAVDKAVDANVEALNAAGILKKNN